MPNKTNKVTNVYEPDRFRETSQKSIHKNPLSPEQCTERNANFIAKILSKWSIFFKYAKTGTFLINYSQKRILSWNKIENTYKFSLEKLANTGTVNGNQ